MFLAVYVQGIATGPRDSLYPDLPINIVSGDLARFAMLNAFDNTIPVKFAKLVQEIVFLIQMSG